MQSIRDLGFALLAWLADNPAFTVVLFTAVIWPALSGVLSFAWRKLEERAPNVIALLRAVGLDLPGAKRAMVALVSGFLARRGVKTPPMPLLPLAMLVLSLAVVAPACGFLAAHLPEIVAAVSEAATKIDLVEDFVRRFFAAYPDPKREAEVMGAIGRARSTLAAAEHAAAGADSLTKAQKDDAFAEFRRAWDELEAGVAGIPGLRLVRPGDALDGISPNDLVIRRPVAAQVPASCGRAASSPIRPRRRGSGPTSTPASCSRAPRRRRRRTT
jgi:hypothetical protein